MGARGFPKTGGRRKGVPNAATTASRRQAQAFGEEALMTLVEAMRDGETRQVRIAAALALLDRGYGRPGLAPEPADEKEDEGPKRIIVQFVDPKDGTLRDLPAPCDG
jgi:hypothetical protein